MTIGVQEATKDIARDEKKCIFVGAKMEERDQDVDDEIFTILRVFISSIAWSPNFTGGKGAFTQWAHCEFIVGFETIRPANTHWANYGFF